MRVVDPLSQHLETTAHPEHGQPGSDPADHRLRQPVVTNPLEVREGRPGAGQDAQVGGQDDPRVCRDDDIDPRLVREGVGVRRVRGAGQAHDRDGEPLAAVPCPLTRPAGGRQTVLRVEPHVVQEGENTEDRPVGAVLEHLQPGTEQVEVAAELVDDPRPHVHLVLGVEDRQRAEHGGEDATSVDIPDDHDREVLGPGEAEVDVVPLPEVDLRRAAGAFGDDDIEPRGEVVVGRERLLRQRCRPGGPLAGLEVTPRPAQDDDV